MSAFVSAYGLARFAGRRRPVAVAYGLWAWWRQHRAARRMAPDALHLRRGERLP